MKDPIVFSDEHFRPRRGEPRLSFDDIGALDARLTGKYRNRLVVDPTLSRSLVSFQASKSRPRSRWYKFKEAYSDELVQVLLRRHSIASGKLLDPFAGSGTSLFAAQEMGLDADGIELLPIGQMIVEARSIIETKWSKDDEQALRRWINDTPWKKNGSRKLLPTLRITQGAYPEATIDGIERFSAAYSHEKSSLRAILQFALLCVLESISFTRKDGQYLRWDDRSHRRVGKKPFNKGAILEFDSAIINKLNEIQLDHQNPAEQPELFLSPSETVKGRMRLFPGSCLEILPTLEGNFYDVIMTSPPYCNRYDYTRTYALELALLGIDEDGIRGLRQQMLSCTVENREKSLLEMHPGWEKVLDTVDRHDLLQAILKDLEKQKLEGKLNNNGVPRMVRGYFYEMACVMEECARVLKRRGRMFMVNDNVRYAGIAIPVDLILSDFAEASGFKIDRILVLPTNKGNSSQQMGRHGREGLRKCVYIWSKP